MMNNNKKIKNLSKNFLKRKLRRAEMNGELNTQMSVSNLRKNGSKQQKRLIKSNKKLQLINYQINDVLRIRIGRSIKKEG